MKTLSSHDCETIKRRIIAGCTKPTGFPEVKDPLKGCGQRTVFEEGRGGRFEFAACRCLQLFKAAHRHVDFGFRDWPLFLHDIATVQTVGTNLADYLADPEAAWNGRGLFIWGEGIGVGKTTLAYLVTEWLFGWADRNNRVGGDYRAAYMFMNDFSDRAWRGRTGFDMTIEWGGGYEATHYNALEVRGPFVLDELGRENRDSNKFESGRTALEEMLRERRALPTIIGSHIPPSGIVISETPQIASLLSERFVAVEVQGGDRRRNTGNPFFPSEASDD